MCERFDPKRFGGDWYGTPNRGYSDMVGRAVDRQWNPWNDGVLKLDVDFEFEQCGIMPQEWFPDLRTRSALALSEADRLRLGNEIVCWLLSGILHGEQAALLTCSHLCGRQTDPALQEVLAIQVREEARHVAAFSRYLTARFGRTHAAGDAFGRFLRELVDTDSPVKKIIGISIIIEGFAMGAFANLQLHTRDPALRQLLKLIQKDEAAHHQFGIVWLDQQLRNKSVRGRSELRSWVARAFAALLVNLVSVRQRRAAYDRAGLDWRPFSKEVRHARTRTDWPMGLEDDINPLTVLANVLDRRGLLGKRERLALSQWLELGRETRRRRRLRSAH
jgi:rubrerythrin